MTTPLCHVLASTPDVPDDRSAAIKFQIVVEACCSTGIIKALEEALQTTYENPYFTDVVSHMIPKLLQVATLSGDVSTLNALRTWQINSDRPLTPQELGLIAKAAKHAARENALDMTVRHNLYRSFHWWLDGVGCEHEPATTNILLTWAISLYNLDTFSSLLNRISAQHLDAIISQSCLSKDLAKALAAVASRPTFLESYEMIRQSIFHAQQVDQIMHPYIPTILLRAASNNNLHTITYLLRHTFLFRPPPPPSPSPPSYSQLTRPLPTLPLSILSPPLRILLSTRSPLHLLPPTIQRRPRALRETH